MITLHDIPTDSINHNISMTININLKTINNNNKAGDKSQNSSAGQDRAARSEMGEESGNDNNGRVFTARITTALLEQDIKASTSTTTKNNVEQHLLLPLLLLLKWHVKASKTLYQ